MQKTLTLLAILTFAFTMGVVIAIAKGAPQVDKRVRVDVVKSGDMVDIAVLPSKGYKWNDEYPATIKFSVCNDQECIIVTKEIKIKKD